MSNDPIVCPFCPLCCDDLRVDPISGETDVPCHVAQVAFASAIRPPSARLESQPIETINWDALRQSLSLKTPPVVDFIGATIAEAKTLDAMVKRGQIRLRIDRDASARSLDQTIARDGLLGTTLGDAVRRAEYAWVIGNPDHATPRLKERLNQSGLAIEYTPSPGIALLSRLHELLRRETSDAEGEPCAAASEADRLHEHFRHSRSTVVVVGDAPFEPGEETIASELLLRWIAGWNESALPIGSGDDPIVSRVTLLRLTADQNLHTVMRWRNNHVSESELSQPPRPAIRIGTRLSGSLSAVSLQIGGPDPGESIAKAYLPAAVPGVHHADTTIRGDGSVTLPLAGLTTSPHPSRIEVLQRVLGAV
ncbi:hypothetical protein Mal15_35930 [Stieleria maiorica]|uniref:Formylmethanofuran dehydrogenase subunit B n=1 Tax=Stieleria maiorica TaxID=2795974 RepID=A0A5B9MEK3_9BACT|nr:hypothetical protein [Stieleria maiorica]QEF99528.1 hypothetical protein Mal15_35930 [Stieleria maiorica]